MKFKGNKKALVFSLTLADINYFPQPSLLTTNHNSITRTCNFVTSRTDNFISWLLQSSQNTTSTHHYFVIKVAPRLINFVALCVKT